MKLNIRKFVLKRIVDCSGVSGTGIVAEGVEFSDGTCALRWLSHMSSEANYPNIKCLEATHGHEGSTIIVWDEEVRDLKNDIKALEGLYKNESFKADLEAHRAEVMQGLWVSEFEFTKKLVSQIKRLERKLAKKGKK